MIRKRRWWEHLVDGFGTLLDLWPPDEPEPTSRTPLADDWRAVASDWQAVGNDLRAVLPPENHDPT